MCPVFNKKKLKLKSKIYLLKMVLKIIMEKDTPTKSNLTKVEFFYPLIYC